MSKDWTKKRKRNITTNIREFLVYDNNFYEIETKRKNRVVLFMQ